MGKRLFSLFTLLLLLSVAATGADKRFVLVIDAGHGGRDAGACGAISKEKDLTLRYALAFGKMVERNCSDVKVIYTRKTDTFLELWQRAEVANKNKASLFISVHINSLPKGRIARGFQTYTLGKGRVSGSSKGINENLEVAKRENSVILLEKNYKQTYQGFDPNSPESNIMFEFIQDKNMERSVDLARFMQREVCAATGRQDMGAFQDNLAVLRLSSMPGCLIELGFISTPDEEQFLNSREAVDLYAQGIFRAFLRYKNKYHGGEVAVPYQPSSEKQVTVPPVVVQDKNTPETEKRKQESPKTAVVAAPVSRNEQPSAVVPQVSQETRQPVEQVNEQPVFKVQILVSSQPLKSGDSRLKGVSDVDYYQENGMYKYTVGASTDYPAVNQTKKELMEKFPEAFIIAFKGGKRVNAAEAIREYRQNKK